MATRAIKIDDLDGESGASAYVLFAFEGSFWELDLSDKHHQELREVMNKYVRVARPVSERDGYIRMGTPSHYADVDPEDVRAWCKRNSVPVNAKGRIPDHVIEKYKEATAD